MLPPVPSEYKPSPLPAIIDTVVISIISMSGVLYFLSFIFLY